jgi:hypothetical protein
VVHRRGNLHLRVVHRRGNLHLKVARRRGNLHLRVARRRGNLHLRVVSQARFRKRLDLQCPAFLPDLTRCVRKSD